MKTFYAVKIRYKQSYEFLVFKKFGCLKKFVAEYIGICKRWYECFELIKNKITQQDLNILLFKFFGTLKDEYKPCLMKHNKLVLMKNISIKPLYTITFD